MAHILVDRDGKIFQCRPFDQSCQHAGRSRMRHPQTNKLYDGLNSCSIGIEIANSGDGGDENLHERLKKHFPQAEFVTAKHRNADTPGSNAAEHKRTRWEAYPKAQLDAVFGLIKLLTAKYKLVEITGHDCVAYERKTDPGPAFPMEELRVANGLSGLPAVWDKDGNRINV
jgi:N-acetylmuramoyl-L-alanine amidase